MALILLHITIKEKPCKGTGKAKGYGCDKKSLKRTYGLCDKCYGNWLHSTPEGIGKLNKTLKQVRIKIDKEERKNWREKKIEAKQSDYKKELQREINRLARKIDLYCGYGCIDCDNNTDNQIDAAHFHSVGSNSTLRFNLHNIHAARAYCNKYSKHHLEGYKEGLEKRYDAGYKQYVINGLPFIYRSLKLTGKEIHEKLTIVRKLNREFDNNTNLFVNMNGKEIRDYYNKIIGIYN